MVRVINVNYEKGEEIRENDGYLRGREDGYISGKEDGMKKGIVDVAAKMKCSGMPKGQIIQLTGLNAEEIEKLQSNRIITMCETHSNLSMVAGALIALSGVLVEEKII